MRLEYIRLRKPELIYGKKELLEYELSFLLVVKKFEELQKLRKLRIEMKKELKLKMSQALKYLADLENNLPDIGSEHPAEEKEQVQRTNKNPALEQEIANLKAKIEVLQEQEDE